MFCPYPSRSLHSPPPPSPLPSPLPLSQTWSVADAVVGSTLQAVFSGAARAADFPATAAWASAVAATPWFQSAQGAAERGAAGGAPSGEAAVALQRRQDLVLGRLKALEARVAAAEKKQSGTSASSAPVRVMSACAAAGAPSAILVRAPAEYYAWPLAERARFLGCPTAHLCKTIVMENIHCTHDALLPRFNSRFYAVVVQYVAKLNIEKIKKVIREQWPTAEEDSTAGPCPSNKHFKFQVAPGDASARLTGFEHNAVTLYGMREPVPILVDEAVAALPFVWMGGGEESLKLKVNVREVVAGLGCIVGRVSTPRGEGEADDA